MFCGWWLCSLQQLSTIPGIKKFQCHYRWCDTRREQRNLLSTHDLSIWQLITFERSQIKVDNLQNNIVAIKCFHEMLVTWLTWLSNNSKSISWLCPLQVALEIFVSVTYKMQGAELNKLQTLPFLNLKPIMSCSRQSRKSHKTLDTIFDCNTVIDCTNYGLTDIHFLLV